jgi:hypothetical protein
MHLKPTPAALRKGGAQSARREGTRGTQASECAAPLRLALVGGGYRAEHEHALRDRVAAERALKRTRRTIRTLIQIIRTLIQIIRTLIQIIRTLIPIIRTLFQIIRTLVPIIGVAAERALKSAPKRRTIRMTGPETARGSEGRSNVARGPRLPRRRQEPQPYG